MKQEDKRQAAIKPYEIAIGIDTGVNTGFAIWDKRGKCFSEISTLPVHKALFKVKEMHDRGYKMVVVVEDARKRKWFGNSGREQLQGAGSIKRDASLWEDFLKDSGINYRMVAPKDNKTKLKKDVFGKITGYSGSTSVHSRDAAMLVYQY